MMIAVHHPNSSMPYTRRLNNKLAITMKLYFNGLTSMSLSRFTKVCISFASTSWTATKMRKQSMTHMTEKSVAVHVKMP